MTKKLNKKTKLVLVEFKYRNGSSQKLPQAKAELLERLKQGVIIKPKTKTKTKPAPKEPKEPETAAKEDS